MTLRERERATAEQQAAEIAAFWAAKGYEVRTRVVEIPPTQGPDGKDKFVGFRIASNMVGGLPRKLAFVNRDGVTITRRRPRYDFVTGEIN